MVLWGAIFFGVYKGVKRLLKNNLEIKYLRSKKN